MRAKNQPDHNTHCFRCYQRKSICVCPVIPEVNTQAEFIILRHVYEAERPSNTGRLAALALPNSRLVTCGGGVRIGQPRVDEELLSAPGTWLLWPDGKGSEPDEPGTTTPARVVVIDATWQQARRIYGSMPALWKMPRLSLPAPDTERERLRGQHRAEGMSTLEAIAAAVARLEGSENAAPLENLYDELVRRRNSLRWGSKPPVNKSPLSRD